MAYFFSVDLTPCAATRGQVFTAEPSEGIGAVLLVQSFENFLQFLLVVSE